jgi:hypothetical protein
MAGLLDMEKLPYLRSNYPLEDLFFQKRPDVGGMAAIDNQVILNPYSKLNEMEKLAVYENELARIKMRSKNFSPNFSLTKEQEKYLNSNDYKNASSKDRNATIAARIASGDSSSGIATKEQLDFVKNKLNSNDIGLLNRPSTLGGLNITEYQNPFKYVRNYK